jgi:RNA polymerase sigma factor (sigma-70 family)
MHMPDSEVVASIVAGEPAGLAQAYDRYANPLYQYCRTLLGDPAAAADAVQDTFVLAASSLRGLRDAGRLRPWLYAVARNQSLRAPRAGREPAARAQAPDVSDGAGDVSPPGERGDLAALFDGAAAGLSAGEREVIELRLRQGLEPAEVASVLGVSRGHAGALVSRARDQLETCLAVLLVARAGRADCAELSALLAGWDGHLTVPLRQRLHRHIDNCAACSARRAIELRPAMLLGLTPAAALATGAAASFRLAADVPPELRAHTIGLATGPGADAAAHRAAVLSRAGTPGRSGFPRAGAPARGLAPAGWPGGPGWPVAPPAACGAPGVRRPRARRRWPLPSSSPSSSRRRPSR